MSIKELLDSLSLAFDKVNEEKENIEAKVVKTTEELNELEEIKNFFKFIDERRNSWLTEKETITNQSPSADLAGEISDSIYRDREEVFDFRDSSTDEGIEEQQAEEVIDGVEILNSLIDNEIKEEQPEEKKEQETTGDEILNNLINDGIKEEQVQSFESEPVIDDEKVYNSSASDIESTELVVLQEQEKEFDDYEQQAEVSDDELAAMLRKYFESDGEKKKTNPIKNFVTKVKKRVTLPKVTKKDVASGLQKFVKNISSKMPRFSQKKKKETAESIEKEVNWMSQYQSDYEYLDNENAYQNEVELNYGVGQIGSTITVSPGKKTHNNAFDACFGKNGYPTYYNNEEERVVIGVAIVNDNGMTSVYASDSNYNQKIKELMQNGGEIVSLLTANKKYLYDWDGITPLNWDEIRAYKEGWYNINDVENKNMKGFQR